MLVLCQEAVAPLTLVRSRAIGLMTMVDSGKKDHKVLAVAMDDPEFNSFQEASELPEHRLTMLRRFFLDYKTLEHKTVEVEEFQAAAAAVRPRLLLRPRADAHLPAFAEPLRRETEMKVFHCFH